MTGGGTNDALVARLVVAEVGVVLKYTLTEALNNVFTQTMVTAGAVANSNVYFLLNAFIGVDVTSVKSVVFSIENGAGEPDADARFSLLAAVAVPEPTTLAMFGFGALGLLVAARRRRQIVTVCSEG